MTPRFWHSARAGCLGGSHPTTPSEGLQRGLSARQVQMIAVAGTIGTGLFLGTGRSLATGGPASLLIYVHPIPVAGSFNAYTTRFFSPSYGFALSWNYWFNDAVSVASDLVAAQLLLQFWTPWHSWVISLVFWVFLVGINSFHVKAYGELEYWLSSLKVVTIIIFIILGILVNVGVNSERRTFPGGFGGFVKVFVTASFAFGGTESLGITAGETKNPSKNMPRVVKFVFWRVLLIGLNEAGPHCGSFMNTVILTSVLSAGNHALFAGTRVLYGMVASASGVTPPQAPKIFAYTTKRGIPLPALLLTSSISILCFGASFIGSGVLWGWLQNLVGVSNQIAWFSIGLASWRFRKAWVQQGRSLNDLKFRASWTWPWGPPFVVRGILAVISLTDLRIIVMIVMFTVWVLLRDDATHDLPSEFSARPSFGRRIAGKLLRGDLVDTGVEESNKPDNERHDTRLAGKYRYCGRPITG
ncbi:amino acid permease-domain-containing protein [Infundibulicybe gibba]|nr:amino acid permease-domain-containing protein [Infundibulicybe gibba]